MRETNFALRRFGSLLFESVKDQNLVSEPRIVKRSISASPVLYTQFFDTGSYDCHLPREWYRESLAFLQVKDRLAEFPAHFFRETLQSNSRLWVEDRRLHKVTVSDVGHDVKQANLVRSPWGDGRLNQIFASCLQIITNDLMFANHD